MVAAVALLICFLGWCYFVRSKRSLSLGIDFDLAVPLVWFLIIASRPVSLWFTSASSLDDASLISGAEGDPLNRFIALGLLATGMLILARRRVSVQSFVAANKLLIALTVYSALSVMWSDFPAIAFKRWFRHLGTMIFLLILLTDRRGFRAIVSLVGLAAYILLPTSIILFKWYPRLGREYHVHSGEMAITGVTTNKNSLGLLCMVSALFLLYELHKEWSAGNHKSLLVKGDFCLLVVAVWLLFMSNSATSMLSFGVGCVIYYALGTRFAQHARKPWLLLAVLTLTAIIPAILSGTGSAGSSSSIASVVDMTGHSNTFWGRTVLWQVVIDMVKNPLIGCGYDSFWLGNRLDELWRVYWWHPNEAHNGFVGVYASLGLIGCFIVFCILAQGYQELFRRFRASNTDLKYRLAIAFLTAAVVYNITEFAFLGLSPVWFLLLLMIARPPAGSQDISGFIPGDGES